MIIILPLSLSQNRMRLRALVYFPQVPCRSPEELLAGSPSQNPKRLRLPLVNRKAISKELLQKNYVF